MTAILDAFALVSMTCGVLLLVITAIGLLRLPDVLSRMHAATKPQLAGLILLLTGLALELRAWGPLGLLLIAVLAQILTAPVSAHFVGRAAYRSGQYRADLLSTDDQNRSTMRQSTASAHFFGRQSGDIRPPVRGTGPVIQLSSAGGGPDASRGGAGRAAGKASQQGPGAQGGTTNPDDPATLEPPE
ncbi:monovalent cation/H(+) antiporter subunit G [Micrococcales bacterium 31B]|nr:monovalent cation/H(+) antiporter subunit G [Micrococcales bacterium 31B]